jgi:outer membrane protein assembly factor BamD (BamD/ComL family)
VSRLYRQARDRLSEYEFRVGLTNYRIRNYPGAVLRFTELSRTDPEYTKRDELFYYMGETLRKMTALPEALPLYDRIVKEFPKSKYRERAEKRVAELKRSLAAAAAPGKPPGRP